jgi:hypothetical protein
VDHIGCSSCGYAAKSIPGIRQQRCPRCANSLREMSADEAWELLRQRIQNVRFERASQRRRLRLAAAARRMLA